MLQMFTISNVDASVLERAASLEPYDFEDAVQYLSALPYHPDMVITRDKKGFNDLGILVMTPAEFVQKAKEWTSNNHVSAPKTAEYENCRVKRNSLLVDGLYVKRKTLNTSDTNQDNGFVYSVDGY